MNILFSVPKLHTNYSGMIKGLVDSGHNVSFIAMDGNEINLPYNLDIKVYHIKALNHKFSIRNRNKQLFIPKIKELRNILKHENPDFIIARDLMAINFLLSILSIFKKTKVLYYDQTPEYVVNLKHFIWIILSRILISKYRMTTVRKENPLRRKNFKNTFFIPFPVPVSKDKISLEIKSQTSINYLKVITIGKLDQRRKNLCHVINELSSLLKKGKVKLSIYGALRNENSKVYKELLRKIKDEKVDDFVNVFENVSFEKVQNAYFDHHLFILPSYDELAAISHFEAMNSGLPVIVTSENGTNYVIDEGLNGFTFNPFENGDLLSRVSKFVDNPKLILGMGKKAKTTININYSQKKFSDNLEEIFNNIS